MHADDSPIERLLEQALASGLTPEEVCLDSPELLPEVRRRWQECRAVDAELAALFPSSDPEAKGSLESETDLPDIPGYELYEVLGHGGMGIVFRARHLRLDRQIALKMILPAVYPGPIEFKRFEREAQIIASLCHPHIVQVFDVGDVAGRPFYAMEFISGGSLANRLNGHVQPARDSADLISKLADAIDLVHRSGIIHRDIKPGNILLALDGVAKVSDFGLAFQAEGGGDFAFSPRRLGTPSYMAPEQALGETSSIGPAADIYSLGAVLFEMLTGRPPGRVDMGASGATGSRQAVPETPLSRPRIDSRVPRDLRAICLKCLEREPRQRYRTAGELRDDLRRFLNRIPVQARPVTRTVRLHRWIERNRSTSVALLFVGLLLSVVLVGSMWSAAHFRNLARDNGELATDNGRLARRYESERDKALGAERRESHLLKQSEAKGAIHRKDLYVAEMTLAAQAAAQTGGIARVQDLLNHWNQTWPDLRDWEWYYLKSLCHRDKETYRVHLKGALSVSWSPNGMTVASSGADRTICLIDRLGKVPHRRLSGHQREVVAVAWSHDGARLASASWDHSVKVWNVESSQLLLDCAGHTAEALCVGWSPDDKLIASGCKDGGVRIWDSATGELRGELRGHSDAVAGVAWSPNGSMLASASHDFTVRLWSVPGLTEKSVLRGHVNWVNCVAWSHNGSRCGSSSNDQTVRIWDPETGVEVLQFKGHTLGVKSLSWSPDDERVATVSDDSSLRVWSSDGKELFKTVGHTSEPTGVSWSPTGTEIASSSFDGSIKLWDAQRPLDSALPLNSHGNIEHLAWNPVDSNKLAICWSEGVVEIWDRQHANSVAIRADGTYLRSATWRPDGTELATASADGLIRIWDPSDSDKPPRRLDHGHELLTISWDPSGHWLASAGLDHRVALWDAATGERRHWHTGHRAPVCTLDWQADGQRVATGSRDGSIKIWNALSGELIRTYEQHRAPVVSVAWNPHRQLLASASIIPIIHLWDAQSGELLRTLHGHTSEPSQLVWNPEGRRLASVGRDDQIKLWSAESDREILSLESRQSRLTSLSWSPDGSAIATAGEDRIVKIHDASTGYLIGRSPKLLGELDRRPNLVAGANAFLLRAQVYQGLLDWTHTGENLAEYLKLASLPWIVLDAYVSKPYHVPNAGLFVSDDEETAIVHSAELPSNASAWRRLDDSHQGVIDLSACINGRNDTSVYVLFPVFTAAEQPASILLGSDDDARVWLNQKMVYEFVGSRSAQPDQDIIPIRFKVGWNWILVEVANRTGDHGLYLRLSQSNPKVTTTDEAKTDELRSR